MADRLWFLFTLWSIFMAGGLVHMSISWLLTEWMKMPAKEFKIFYGKALLSFTFRETEFMVGWIPLGMSVGWGEEHFEQVPAKVRAIIPPIGPLIVSVGAIASLGPQLWLEQVTRSIPQILDACLHPMTVALPTLTGFYAAKTPALVFLGVVWVKYAVFNLYPLPVLAGGQWLAWVLLLTRMRKGVEIVSTASALLVLANWVSWAVVMIRFVAQG